MLVVLIANWYIISRNILSRDQSVEQFMSFAHGYFVAVDPFRAFDL